MGGHRTCSYLESKTEPSVAKAQDYMGGHRTEKPYTLLKRGTIGVGTPHMKMCSDVLLRIQDRAKCGKDTGLQKNIYCEGGTQHILS